MKTDLRNLQQKYGEQESAAGQYMYHGVPIFCTGGIHEGIFEAFQKRNKSKDCAILVLGSGPGAFERRLLDHGYTNITSVEFVAEHFMVTGTKFFPRDLNQDFADLGTFDAIFAIELIEHLENQFHFMRNVRSMMKPESVFYLSTPNVESGFARIKYALTGRLQYFGPGELAGTGHITPIFNHILRFNLDQNGLAVAKHFTNANVWSKPLHYKNILIRMAYVAMFCVSACLPNKNTFEISLFEIVHKKD